MLRRVPKIGRVFLLSFDFGVWVLCAPSTEHRGWWLHNETIRYEMRDQNQIYRFFKGPRSKVKVQSPESRVQCPRTKVRGPKLQTRRHKSQVSGRRVPKSRRVYPFLFSALYFSVSYRKLSAIWSYQPPQSDIVVVKGHNDSIHQESRWIYSEV